jgi:hypothetical protein
MTALESMRLAAATALSASVAVDAGLTGLFPDPSRVSFAACGATAMAVEAALRDAGAGTNHLFQDADGYIEAHAARMAGALVGISMSGHSVEVRDMLKDARGLGEVTAFVTGGAPMEKPEACFNLDLATMPTRFLPIVACVLVHRFLGSPFGEELAKDLATGPKGQLEELRAFLAAAHRDALTPLFISAGKDPVTRMLASLYMEFLKRPAFHASFPSWTHDLLWSLSPGDAGRLVLVHERPLEDLGDGRFGKALDRLGRLGIRQLVLDLPPAWMERHPSSSRLAAILLSYAGLAEELGIDPHAEASFR